MSEQKKYLFIESASKYPYISSNSEDVWNYIKSTNILTTGGLSEVDYGRSSFVDLDLDLAKDNISSHGILREIVDIVEPTLKILDCEVVLIRASVGIHEFNKHIHEYLNTFK